MKKLYKYSIYLLTGIFLVINISCNKYPLKTNFKTIQGLVIGKELCRSDPNEDYWLIDCSPGNSDGAMIGDSIVLNGKTYNNVVKINGLSVQFKEIGKYISIEYKVIKEKSISSGCSVSNPVTFPVKEIIFLTVVAACCAP